MENGFVKTEINEQVAIIEFFHPKGNSLPSELLKQLTSEINLICKNKSVNAILLKSSGEKTFCAGASFDELLQIENSEQGKLFFSGFGNLIYAMKSCPKFIILAVQGKAVGGGVGLIASADYVFALNSAMVRLSELNIGIAPFVIAEAVESRIGKSAFMEMTIDTEWKNSNWAVQKGLFNKLCESYSELQKLSLEFALKVSRYSPDAVKEIKNIFWQNIEKTKQINIKRAQLSGKLILTESSKEFLNNFKKR